MEADGAQDGAVPRSPQPPPRPDILAPEGSGSSVQAVTSRYATISEKEAFWKDCERDLELFMVDNHVTSHPKYHRQVTGEILLSQRETRGVLQCFMHLTVTSYMSCQHT